MESATTTADDLTTELLTIVFADDDEGMRGALTALFKREPGFDLVGIGCDAEQAVALVAAHRPRIALLDIAMPGGGGIKAAREIRIISPGTRIVALTAHEDPHNVNMMIGAGALGYVLKGAPVEEILDTITRAASA